MTTPIDFVAVHAIQKLKARYFRMIDTRDWPGFASVFASDGHLEVFGASGKQKFRVAGNYAIAEFVRVRLEGARSVHHGHMPEIEIVSADEAFGIWAMEDRLVWPDRSFHGWGHYHEHYRCIEGEWVIARCTLRRLELAKSGLP